MERFVPRCRLVVTSLIVVGSLAVTSLAFAQTATTVTLNAAAVQRKGKLVIHGTVGPLASVTGPYNKGYVTLYREALGAGGAVTSLAQIGPGVNLVKPSTGTFTLKATKIRKGKATYEVQYTAGQGGYDASTSTVTVTMRN
jgi:hypothetical protein